MSREAYAFWVLAIFTSQLFINVVVLGLVIYKVTTMNRFFVWSKDYLTLTKQYIELIAAERMQVKREVHKNAVETQTAVQTTGEEIKQEMRQTAAIVKSELEKKNGS